MAAVLEERRVDANTEGEDNKEDRIFSLEVLAVIKESQQQHGLRHDDYQRYRSYCTRRLRRIRKCVNLVQGVKHRYAPKKLNSQSLKDVRCLYIPLVQAERCWSYAMQLKGEAKKDQRKRFHMVNKLRKAEHYSRELVDLCNQVTCDARTKLEVQAYHEWMSGTVQYELKQWHSALDLLTKSKVIYEKLGNVVLGDTSIIYKQRVSDIEPSLRFCAYNIGDTTAASDLVGIRLAIGHSDAALDELIQKTRERQAGSLHEVTWRGRVIPIMNDRVRVFLLAVQESEKEVEAVNELEAKIDVYDRVIKECVEALQVLKEDLKSDTVFRQIQRGQQVEGHVPVQVFLHSYLLYIKVKQTVHRNLLLVQQYKSQLGQPSVEGQKVIKPQDLARLYEIIIQSLTEIPSLPGLHEDEEMANQISCEITAYKAFRCFFLALSYSIGKQWPEVVALAKRAAENISKSLPSLKGNSQLSSELRDLSKQVDSLLIQAQASSILDSSQDVAKDTRPSIANDKRPLIERLDEYLPEDPKMAAQKLSLIRLPPDMEPIPCKPLFFDLAFNHAQFPKLSHKIEQQEKKAGLTGFVKSWIGGWGGKK